MGMLAIVAAVAWLLAFFLCAAVTRIPPPRTGAAAAPGAGPGLAAGVRLGHGRARTDSGDSVGTPRPSVAWSSWGGQWRLVRIDPVFTGRWHPAAWLPFVVWLAGLAFAASLLPSPFGELLPLLPAAGAAAAAIAAVRGLAVRLVTPAEASFRGQVIARWMETRGNG